MQPTEIELISELSSMQQAMLFHSLYAPGSGVYVLQMSLRLTGRLDIPAFERAWKHVIARHEILRTAFFWEDLEMPRQVVFHRVDLEIESEDWSGLAADAQRDRLARHLEADQERGFDLAKAPLMRLALFALAPGAHQLVWTQHHLVVDGWSQGQVLRELLATYAAFSDGQEPRLEKASGFRQYLAWLQRQDLGQAESFWRRSLAGLTAPTFLAGDGRAEGPAFREARRRDLTLPPETSAALRDVARRHRLTLSTLVQGAWALVLAQETGRQDVVFGATVAGRPAELPGVESIVGPFINTLPLRVEVRLERRLHDWLAALQERLVAMRRFEHAPLVDVQRWSELPSGVALFDHILVFENLALSSGRSHPLPDLEIVEESASSLTNYPLALIVLPEVGLTLSFRYDTGRFEAPAVGRMLEHLAGLLGVFAEDRDLPLGELPLLLPAERHQVLVEWNDTESSSLSTGGCVHELVALQAGRTPDAVAVSCEGAELTWRELERRSSQLAHHLIRLGVALDDRVGVLMERSLEMMVGLLGILKAGAAYVPLDPTDPPGRLALLAESSGARRVLSLGRLAHRFPDPSVLVVLDEGGWEEIAALPETPPAIQATEGNLAYVIFTSGSTGTPKGVMIPQGGIVNRLLWMIEAYGFDGNDRVLQKTPFSFDVSLWELFCPLLTGARLILARPEGHKDPDYLAGLIARDGITVVHFVPSMLQVFLEAPGLAALSSLRMAVASGEALPADLVRRFSARVGRLHGAGLHNLYGPTEASVDVSCWPCVPDPPGSLIPIGRPILNLRLHVTDADLRPQPIGIAGELLLGGVGLARGYLGRPELTAEAFVPDPFGGEPGGRLYRTGDLARFLPDGNVEYLGRIDHQVKIRGFRIELGEIEAALAAHPAVREAVVLVREGSTGERRLVGYGVAHNGLSATAELRAFLKERLPEHMIPAAFVWLPMLPLTPNGKVDRRALPAPEAAQSAAGEAAGLLRTPAEEMIAGIWSELLGVAGVGAGDNFFELGGHSLLATRVVSRLRAAFGIDLPLRALFDTPTVAALARSIESGPLRSGTPDATPLEAVPRDLPLPLSYSQQQLWFLQRMEPESSAYTIFLPFRLAGRLDVTVLGWTLDEIVRRHEVLRTVFVDVDGAPEQRIAAQAVTALPQVDCSQLEKERRETELGRLAREARRRPFDLASGPLLRVLLVRLGATEHAVLAALHHIAGDGWSLGVLVREVGELYAARCAGRAAPLPDLPIQYADFAHWQRRWLSGEILEEQLAYWRERLDGARDALRLPTERPRHEVADARSAFSTVTLSPGVSARLVGLSRSADATLFMTLLAGYMALLRFYAQQDDIVVGTPFANRRRVETEGLIGLLTNTLVLRADLSDNPTFREVIARVREAALGAYAHQDLPFLTLVEALRLERDPSRSPLFQVWFVLQNTPRAALDLPGLELRQLELKEGEARHDLSLDLTETPAGIRGFFEYKTALFRPVLVEQMARDLEALLELVTRDPEVRLDQLESELVELARRLRAQREDELEQSISRDLGGLKGRTGRRAVTVVRRGQ